MSDEKKEMIIQLVDTVEGHEKHSSYIIKSDGTLGKINYVWFVPFQLEEISSSLNEKTIIGFGRYSNTHKRYIWIGNTREYFRIENTDILTEMLKWVKRR